MLGGMDGTSVVLEVDGKTGEMLAGYRQGLEVNGAILYSNDAGETWKPSQLGNTTATAITLSSASARLYATTASRTGIGLTASDDGGYTWRVAGELPDDAGTTAHDIAAGILAGSDELLLVGTRSGLWTSRDGGSAWWRVGGLPKGSAWRVAFGTEHGERLIYVAVVYGPNDGELLVSRDLVSWESRAAGVFRLDELGLSQPVFAIDEAAGGDAALLTDEGLTRVNMPIRQTVPGVPIGEEEGANASGEYVLRGAGDVSGRFLVQSQNSIYVSDDGQNWRKTLDGGFASLAASPSFESDGVALAGGFRDGVYRTSDRGETWTKVLENPADVTPCSGIAGIVLFSSSSEVVLLVPPTKGWEPF